MLLPGICDVADQNLLPCDGQAIYSDHFLNESLADSVFKHFVSHIQWQQDHIKMFGKVTALPRLTAWYGDPSAVYSYSGIRNTPKAWTDQLLKIKGLVEQEAGAHFNSVLFNYYRCGGDHMSWHTDNERELGDEPIIASLSLGEKRRFQMKHLKRKDLEVVTQELAHGSLLVMKGKMQSCWQHRVCKTQRQVGARINLTFRSVTV